MWAQMIKTRVKPGQEEAVRQLPQEMEQRMRSQANSNAPVRTIVMEDQHNPGSYLTLIFFDSEASAREYERSPDAQQIQQRMMEIWDGRPEFVDLNVTFETQR